MRVTECSPFYASRAGIAVRRHPPSLPAEQFLLKATRHWRSDWESWASGSKLPEQLPVRFAESGMTAALPDFVEMLETLLLNSRRTLNIQFIESESLSRDESRLLTLYRLAQAESEALVIALLTVFVFPAAQRLASQRLVSSMASLAAAGMKLPAPAFVLPTRFH